MFPLAWKIYPLIKFTELLALCITSRGFIYIYLYQLKCIAIQLGKCMFQLTMNLNVTYFILYF